MRRLYEADREVPDTYFSLAEFPSGYTCLMDGTTVNAQGGRDHIRGHEATCYIDSEGVVVVPEKPFEKPFQDKCAAAGLKGQWIDYLVRRLGKDFTTKSLRIAAGKSPLSTTELLHDDFFRCVRTREKPLQGAWEGYIITVVVELGVQSYYQNRTMYFDPDRRELLESRPPRRHAVRS
jgi:hypothetical protein